MRRISITRTQSLVAVTLGVAIGACGPLTVETDNPKRLNESLSAMRESLLEEDRTRFDEAVDYLAAGHTLVSTDNAPGRTPENLAVYAPLAGLTAEAVISTAYVERSKEVHKAISALEHRRKASRAERDELSGFRLSDTLVFKRSRGFLEWPVIELRVHNDTRHQVHLVRLHASLLGRDEVEPWMEEEIDRLVVEGLAPTARDLWRIEPDQREWIQLIDPHPDVDFHLEVVGLFGLGDVTYVSTGWTAVDDHRLGLFRATLESIRSSRRLCLDCPPKRAPTAAAAEAQAESEATAKAERETDSKAEGASGD